MSSLMAVVEFGAWAPQQISTCFALLASLLHRRLSTEGNQTLHDKFGRLLLYIHFGCSCPRNGIVPKFTLRPSLAFSYIGSVTARHSSSLATEVCGVVQGTKLRNFHRGRRLCSAGRPSRWASAHIIVSHFHTDEHSLIGEIMSSTLTAAPLNTLSTS